MVGADVLSVLLEPIPGFLEFPQFLLLLALRVYLLLLLDLLVEDRLVEGFGRFLLQFRLRSQRERESLCLHLFEFEGVSVELSAVDGFVECAYFSQSLLAFLQGLVLFEVELFLHLVDHGLLLHLLLQQQGLALEVVLLFLVQLLQLLQPTLHVLPLLRPPLAIFLLPLLPLLSLFLRSLLLLQFGRLCPFPLQLLPFLLHFAQEGEPFLFWQAFGQSGLRILEGFFDELELILELPAAGEGLGGAEGTSSWGLRGSRRLFLPLSASPDQSRSRMSYLPCSICSSNSSALSSVKLCTSYALQTCFPSNFFRQFALAHAAYSLIAVNELRPLGREAGSAGELGDWGGWPTAGSAGVEVCMGIILQAGRNDLQYNKMQQGKSGCGLELVEEALELFNALLLKEESCRLQLDQPQGQQRFRDYMAKVQAVARSLRAATQPREFRGAYSNAYRVLYQSDSLGYIPEIYDSAQEAFPFIYVNGEQFDFSPAVLAAGERLVESHYQLVHEFRVAALRGEQWQGAVLWAVEELDRKWTTYEQQYISELIGIEEHAKTAIRGIIQAEEALFEFESEQKLRGRIFLSGADFDGLRRQLCEKVSRLNAVANIDGKGRDDLTFEVLAAAENVLATVTDLQSRSVRVLAERIRESWENVREVLRFFGENFEMVDPQLRNNAELVAALQQYEAYWEKGKRYFLEAQKESQIVALSTIVDAAKEKYPHFQELLEYSDPSVFWLIPSLIVLRALEGEDEGLAESFLAAPSGSSRLRDFLGLKANYETEKGSGCGFTLYNSLERVVMGVEEGGGRQGELAKRVKEVGVGLERVSPAEWNDMLGVLLLGQTQ